MLLRRPMMGRDKRAQLLIPAFVVVVASAVGCDGTGYTRTNPPCFDCSNPSGGAYNSGAGNGGAAAFDPTPTGTCPSFIPRNNTECASSLDGSPYLCQYGTDPCAATDATCDMGRWSLRSSAGTCPTIGTGGAAGNAGAAPSDGGAAPSDGGAAPSDGGAAPSDGGAAPDSAAGQGPGPEPMVGCPTTPPETGSACYKPASVTSYRCDYPTACGSFEADCTGLWQLTYHGSATADCAGGAPGE